VSIKKLAWGAIALNLLRIMMGFLFIPHGAQKMFGVLGKEAESVFTLHGAAGPLEFFGGLLILFGWLTRPAAFICAGLMAVAYWITWGHLGFWPILNGGELATIYCFVLLFLWANGGGDFSIDGWLKKGRESGGTT
jgi:putative oxidoreductase